jgi:hypothetical protein
VLQFVLLDRVRNLMQCVRGVTLLQAPAVAHIPAAVTSTESHKNINRTGN